MTKISGATPLLKSASSVDQGEATVSPSAPAASLLAPDIGATRKRGTSPLDTPLRAGSVPEGGATPRKRTREAAFTTVTVDPAQGAKFLAERLNSQDLADLKPVLDAQFAGCWAFTGSVALNIHAIDIEAQAARPFRDADILIGKSHHDTFRDRQKTTDRNAALLNPGTPGGDATHYKFKGMLVDFTSPDSMRKKIDEQIEWVAGVPVRSLKYLIQTKEIDKRDPIDTNLAEKAAADLQVLARLQAKKAARDGSAGAPINATTHRGAAEAAFEATAPSSLRLSKRKLRP